MDTCLLAKPTVRLTWASGIGADGRPQRVADGGIVCPSAGSNWNAAAFSPATRLYYVMVTEKCDVDMPADRTKYLDDQTPKKYLEAINIDDGKIAWRIPDNWVQPTGRGMRGSWRQRAVSFFMATPAAMLWRSMPAMGKLCGTFPPTEKTRPRRSRTRWMESSSWCLLSVQIFSALACHECGETYE